jgi:histidyl-tRNA synthetase
MIKVNTSPLSGMRDFLPNQALQRKEIISKIESIYQLHGFVPIETPSIERYGILTSKYGSDQSLIYNIANADPQGLRYDLTVPLARVMSEYQNELPKFFKRYQIQPVWRADRPQKGRCREFYQCDIDFVGTTSNNADISILECISDVLSSFNLKNYTIRVNDRRIWSLMISAFNIRQSWYMCDYGGSYADQEKETILYFDKNSALEDDDINSNYYPYDKQSIINTKNFIKKSFEENDFNAALDYLASKATNKNHIDGINSLRYILSVFEGINPNIKMDLSLARGLDYYTGTIFEIAVDGMNISIGGGGRYDNLVKSIDPKLDKPGVGCSIGLDRLMLALEDQGLLPKIENQIDMMVIALDQDYIEYSMHVAKQFRRIGYKTEIYPEIVKMKKSMQYASEMKTRYVCIIGENEISENKITIKNMETSVQNEWDFNDLIMMSNRTDLE